MRPLKQYNLEFCKKNERKIYAIKCGTLYIGRLMTMYENNVNKSSGSDPDMFGLISGNTLQKKLDNVGYDGMVSSEKITQQVGELHRTKTVLFCCRIYIVTCQVTLP